MLEIHLKMVDLWKFVIFIILLGSRGCSGQYCRSGQSLEPDGNCRPCTEGHYQDQDYHTLESCKKCLFFNALTPALVLVEKCTPSHNTIVRCEDGFFLTDTKLPNCRPCTNCTDSGQFTGQACSDTEDAICCDGADQVVVKDGQCVSSPPVQCGPGKYLVAGRDGGGDECKRCQVESSNPEAQHRKEECEPASGGDDADGKSGGGNGGSGGIEDGSGGIEDGSGGVGGESDGIGGGSGGVEDGSEPDGDEDRKSGKSGRSLSALEIAAIVFGCLIGFFVLCVVIVSINRFLSKRNRAHQYNIENQRYELKSEKGTQNQAPSVTTDV